MGLGLGLGVVCAVCMPKEVCAVYMQCTCSVWLGLTLTPTLTLIRTALTSRAVAASVKSGAEKNSEKRSSAPGSAKDKIFDVQKSIFGTLSKATGDSRAVDRTGMLLRRVEITSCGLL